MSIVSVYSQKIRTPTSENFLDVQNINVYQVLLEGVMRIFLNCPLIIKATMKKEIKQLKHSTCQLALC
jgi:hypothetical protein